MATPAPQRFAAPLGLRVRLITLLSLAICPVIAVADGILVRFGALRADPWWIAVVTPLLGLAFTGPIVLVSWIAGYRLEHGSLIIERLGRVVVLPLRDLTSASADPAAFRFALKVFGNDGAGSICGRYYSKRLGRFRAFVTDRANAVVLRWPAGAVVVSPDRPAAFLTAVARHAGLSR